MEFSVAIVKCQDGGLEYSEVIKPYVENGETMKLGVCIFLMYTQPRMSIFIYWYYVQNNSLKLKCKP